MREWKRIFVIEVGKQWRSFRRTPRSLESLNFTRALWFLNEIFLSNKIPRNRTCLSGGRVISPWVVEIVWTKGQEVPDLEKISRLDLARFRARRFASNQAKVLSRTEYTFLIREESLISEDPRVLLSANANRTGSWAAPLGGTKLWSQILQQLCLVCSDTAIKRSLMNIRNKTGPRIDPWGTPKSTRNWSWSLGSILIDLSDI